MNPKRIYWLSTIALVSGCAAIGALQLEQRFGTAEPRERVVETLPPGAINYWTKIKPALEKRRVVCHACYDAPAS